MYLAKMAPTRPGHRLTHATRNAVHPVALPALRLAGGRLTQGDGPRRVGVHRLGQAAGEHPRTHGQGRFVHELAAPRSDDGGTENPAAPRVAEDPAGTGDELHEAAGLAGDDGPVDLG